MPLINLLPHANRVRRVHVIDKGESLSFVRLQYTNQNNEWYEIELPLREAMHLQELLDRAAREPQFDSLLRNL